MVDIECQFTSFKASWVGRLLSTNPHEQCWAQLPHYFIGKLGHIKHVVNLNFDNSIIFNEPKKTTPFLQRSNYEL